jgi:hypothetical protein
MRKSVIALAALLAMGMSFTSVRADDVKKTEMTGILIDQHCGDEMAKKEGATAEDIQKAAAEHKKGCALKCGKDGGMALMMDGKMMNLDKDSSTMAMDYLKEKGHKTSVAVMASKNDDGTLAVASIEAAKDEKKAEEKKDDTK